MRFGRRHIGPVAALVVGAVLVVGCSSGGSASAPSNVANPSAPTPGNAAPSGSVALQASVVSGSTTVSPGEPITVAAVNGRLGDVQLVSNSGAPIVGTVAGDGSRWTSSARLGFGTTYTLTANATGTDAAEAPATASATFTTVKPRIQTMPYLTPNDGEVVGVGQPVAVKFDEKITDKRAAVQAIAISANPKVDGAFYWFNDQEVRWRPENHWAPGTKVTVEVNTFGRNLGNGTYGQVDRHIAFSIGDEVISSVDDATKTLSVSMNGAVAKTMPTSMGKNSTPTEHGVFTIGDKHASMMMDSSTFGVPSGAPGGYKTPVKWATRMSYGGVFVHAAPWSVDQQGVSNASHGCLNVSTSNAEWFYDHSKRGDLVIVNGTRGSLLGGTEGLGDWNVPWATWKAGGKA